MEIYNQLIPLKAFKSPYDYEKYVIQRFDSITKYCYYLERKNTELLNSTNFNNMLYTDTNKDKIIKDLQKKIEYADMVKQSYEKTILHLRKRLSKYEKY